MAVHLASVSAHMENMVDRQRQTDDRLKNITSRIRDLEAKRPRL